MTLTPDPVAERLFVYLHRWMATSPRWPYTGNGWSPRMRSAEDLAIELLSDIAFAEIGLASALTSPDGRLIETVVGHVLPFPHGLEFQLLVDALILAGEAQQIRAFRRAALLSVGAVAIIATMALILPSVRRAFA